MELTELQQYLHDAMELLGNGEEINVAFRVDNKGDEPRYILFNACYVYIDDRMVVLSIEGPVCEILYTTPSMEDE